MRLVTTLVALAAACITLAAPASERASSTGLKGKVEPRAGLHERRGNVFDMKFGLVNAAGAWGTIKPGSYLDHKLPPVPPKHYFVLCDRNVTFRGKRNMQHMMSDCNKIRKNYLADPQAPMYWLYDKSRQRTGLVVATYGHCQFKLTYHRHQSFYFGNQDLVDIIGEAVKRDSNYGTIGSCTNHHPYDELNTKHWAREIYWRLDWLKEPATLPDLPPLIGTGPNDFAAVPAWLAPPPPD